MVEDKKNIVAYVTVFNEENRIESLVRNFSWVDELVIVNKSSTDKTREIAVNLGATVVDVPFSSASEQIVENFKKYAPKSRWYIFPTPSSLIHPNIANEILKCTRNPEFKYEVIGLPYKMYVLGIESEYSPWGGKYKIICMSEKSLNISNTLHNEYSFKGNLIFNISDKCTEGNNLYHCTHKTVSDLFLNHIRYTKYEANFLGNNFNYHKELKKAFKELLYSIFLVTVKKKTIRLGWDGIALSLAYISYFIMKFLYIWEANKGLSENTYKKEMEKFKEIWAAIDTKSFK